MRRPAILCAALSALLLTGCFSDEYADNSQPEAGITLTEDASEAVTEASEAPVPYEEEFDPDAENLFYQGLTVAVKDGKKGYIDKNGKWVIEPVFDNAHTFYAGNIAVVRLGEKYGCIDRDGNYLIDPEMEYIDFLGADKYGIYAAAKGPDGREKFGLMDRKGKWVIEPEFDYISGFEENGLSVASVIDEDGNRKLGVIDTSGRFVAEPVYDRIGDFSCGLTFVCIDDKYGYIDERGNVVIEPQFAGAIDFFDDGTAIIMDENNLYGFIDKDGNIIADTGFYKVDFRNGFAENGLAFAAVGTSRSDARYGYINKSGEWVIEPQFKEAKAFSRNGLAAASVRDDSGNEKWGYIDKSGSWVIDPVFNQAYSFDDGGLALVDVDFYIFGVIDEEGNFVIEPKYDDIYYDYTTEMLFDEDLIHVKLEDRFGYIDRSGNEVIEIKYDYLGGFAKNGLAAAMDENGKTGFIDKTGEWVIELPLSKLGSFYDDGYCIVAVDDKYGIIDSEGNFIAEPVFDALPGMWMSVLEY